MLSTMPKSRSIPADPATELRELTREAHGACRDLTILLRQYREARAELVADIRAGIQQAVDDELKEFYRQWQHDANRHATELNESVRAARQHIVEALAVANIQPDDDGGVRIIFKGGLFDDNYRPPT